MGKCKLYLNSATGHIYIGEFASREAAERYYNAIKGQVKEKYGYSVKTQPVYVEQGKGKVK